MSLTTYKLKFVWIYILPILLCVVYWYKNFSLSFNDFNENGFQDSSVWCKQTLTKSKLCKFKNICYDPKSMSFLFYLGHLSVIKGLSNYKDFQTIQLSSVNSHNKFEANITVVDSGNKEIKNVMFFKNGLLFSRFKPDNIMHIIHDDLFPLFLTLEDICLGDMMLCKENYRLVIHDHYSTDLFSSLYQIFSRFSPVFLSQLQKESKLLCFGELHMGLVQDSVFYDYGFDKVHGPVDNVNVGSNDFKRFASYIKNELNVDDDVKSDEKNERLVVLVSRKKSRRILNEGILIEMIERAFGKLNPLKDTRVISLDFIENKTEGFIKELGRASAFVGMHGAEMIFSIFLKGNATVIELFPYGIKPEIVSFIKPVSSVKGIYFDYISWENKFKNNSVFHPDAHPLNGGINFLPKSYREEIKGLKEVPAVRCCDNPMYLHYMYQDTWIDSSFEAYLSVKLSGAFRKKIEIDDEWFYPSVVTDVECFYDSTNGFFNLSWKAPFNMEKKSLYYDVYFINVDSNFEKFSLTKETNLTVEIPGIETNSKIRAWISAVNEATGTKSKDIFVECIL